MSSLSDRLKNDRELRDSARGVFLGELTHVKQEVTPSALGERIAYKVGKKADAVSDKAVNFAGRHRDEILFGLAAAAAAMGLWLIGKRRNKQSEAKPGDGGDQSFEDVDDE